MVDLVTQGQSSFLNRCQAEYRAQIKRCNEPHAVATRIFNDVIDQLESTVFGHDHCIMSVGTLEDFKRIIPIRSYDDFDKYIGPIEKGAQNILTKSKCFALYKTSGTSGKSKLIPATYHWRQQYRGPALYAQWGLYFKLLNMQVFKSGSVLDLSWSRKSNDVQCGIPVYSITSRPSALDGNDWLPPWYEEDWFSPHETNDHVDAVLDMMSTAAFNEVKIIVSVNPSKIAYLHEAINRNLKVFIDKYKKRIKPGLPTRSTELLNLLLDKQSRGEEVLLTDIWPMLSLMVSWCSASAGKYRPWLDVAAPGVPIIPFSTVGTEGIVTIPLDSDIRGSALAINQGIYEFVDLNELADPAAPLSSHQSTLNFDQLELDRKYRLVMTQANGICRYDTQDVYKVVGWSGAVPRLDFVGRSNVGSSFTGEKLTEDDICQAVRRTFSSVCTRLPLFTCIPYWSEPPGYVLAIEAADEAMFTRQQELADKLQKELGRLNEEYEDKCRTMRLRAMQLKLLKPGSFSAIAKAGIQKGVSAVQVKHLWIQPNSNVLKDIKNLNLDIDTTVVRQ